MPDHAMNYEIGNNYPTNSENEAHAIERTHRLQYMVAYLLEKNEELRMQLMARGLKENN